MLRLVYTCKTPLTSAGISVYMRSKSERPVTDQVENEADWLMRTAAELQLSGRKTTAGALLTYIRANFDAMMMVKEAKGLSWTQMAAVLSSRGITKEDGSPLDRTIVSVTAYRVQAERDPAARRRRIKAKQKAETTPKPRPSAPEPARENACGPSFTEYDRMQEEAKRKKEARRAEIEAARNINPFDLGPKAPLPASEPAPPHDRENPYAELERRQEERRQEEARRRALIAAARDINPFDLGTKD
jgi:hypothetical protein